MKKNHSTSSSTYSNAHRNSKLITSTIISHIYKQHINLSSTQKRALSILINTNYEGCCSCNHESDVDYCLMLELTDIINDDSCFEFTHCNNKFCIHIVDRFKIINYILPTYPFDESTLTTDDFLFMIRYGNLAPKEDFDYIYYDIVNHEMTSSDDFEEDMSSVGYIKYSTSIDEDVKTKSKIIYDSLLDEDGKLYHDQKITLSFIEQVITAYGKL